MQTRIPVLILGAVLALAAAACNGERAAKSTAGTNSLASFDPSAEPLYSVVGAGNGADRVPPTSGIAKDPVVIPDCRLTVIDKQDVPSQREGVILFVGTELQPGEQVPPDKLVEVRIGSELKRFRRLKEDDPVEAGQLLAQLDDRLARDDLAMKHGKLLSSKAELAAAEKTRDEAKNRYDTQFRLRSTAAGAVSDEELRATRLTWDRYVFECVSKKEAVGLAELERNQAQTVLDMHQIRSSISGIIKTIYKKRGEAVRNLEPVFQIHDVSRLRIEGLVDVEHLPRLRKGMPIVVEPGLVESVEQTFRGHLQEINGVAVSKDIRRPLIVSAGEDGTARVWERVARHERCIWEHPSPVRAVACTPPGATTNWCLTGASDGIGRLWNLDGVGTTPERELKDQHQGAISCVAFSPDGRFCVTGGDDREICLWETATGTLQYRFPSGHRAALTWVQFTPRAELVSAGRDNTLRVWSVGSRNARLLTTLDRRSGDVAHPAVSPDGKHVLLDQGKSLRLLKLPERRTEAILDNGIEATQFTSFALFSADARLILTAGNAEGRLQLWRAPTATTRPYEIRQYTSRERSAASCAAFAPDGTFVVTGTQDRQVLVWPLPSRSEIEAQLHAEVVLIEQAVESSDRQVRIWAEVANAERRLLPGTTVRLAVYPEAVNHVADQRPERPMP